MKDRVYLGPAPANESCVQVGAENYSVLALRECRAYIQAIRQVCGEEPDGAQLRGARESHDYGQYLEVVVGFDDND